MSDKELLIKELIIKDFNEILVNEFCTDWKEKRLYIELLVRATHFDYLLNYIQQKENKEKEIKEYIEKNWISQKDADNYRFDDEELDIEISEIAVLFDILDKEVN